MAVHRLHGKAAVHRVHGKAAGTASMGKLRPTAATIEYESKPCGTGHRATTRLPWRAKEKRGFTEKEKWYIIIYYYGVL